MPKKVINESVHKDILNIIYTWKGKLTWKLLCERITRECGLKTEVSRHTLLAYKDIEVAFNNRKASFKEEPSHLREPEDVQLKNAYERIDKLQTENKALNSQVILMKEQVVSWMYNLYQMGLNMDEMNQPLPADVDIEDVKDISLPAKVDAEKLNHPLPQITRADDNKRKRSSHES